MLGVQRAENWVVKHSVPFEPDPDNAGAGKRNICMIYSARLLFSDGALFLYSGDVMEIIVNGKTKELDKELSVVELLKHLGITKPGTAVAVNNSIVKKDDHGQTRINDGDRVEILRPIGGG